MTSDDYRAQMSQAAVDANAAIRDLYLWWTVERPNRIDAHADPRIWKDVQRPERFMLSFNRHDPSYDKALKQMSQTDEFYTQQDQAMLEKLISYRRNLWS